MTDVNKLEVFLNELTSVENQIVLLLDAFHRAEEKRLEAEKQVQILKKEIEYYKLQHENQSFEIETKKIEKKYFDSVSVKEKEQIRQKIYDLMNKIDSHIAGM